MDQPIPSGDAAQAQPDASQDDGSYTIELLVKPGGQFEVSVESAASEAGEGEGMDAGEPAGQSFSDLKAALTCIMQTVKNDGQMPQAGGDESAFASGYGMKASGPIAEQPR